MADWKKDHIPDPRDTSFTEDLGKVENDSLGVNAELAALQALRLPPVKSGLTYTIRSCMAENDRLARALAERENSIIVLDEAVRLHVVRLAEARNESERLKCCGNCAHFTSAPDYLAKCEAWEGELPAEISCCGDWPDPSRSCAFLRHGMTSRWTARADEATCPTCGKPAHKKHFLGACGPVSTWPKRAEEWYGG